MAFEKMPVSPGDIITSEWGNHIQTQYDEAMAELDAHVAEFDAHVSEIATQENLGHVKVDGETITASNGIISAQIVDTVTGDKWQWGIEDGLVYLERVV